MMGGRRAARAGAGPPLGGPAACVRFNTHAGSGAPRRGAARAAAVLCAIFVRRERRAARYRSGVPSPPRATPPTGRPRRPPAGRGGEANRLLQRLPRAEYARVAPHFELVDLAPRHVIYEPHEPITHVYFPQSGMFSLVLPLADGGTVEVGLVGREGVAGVPAVLGVETMPTRCVVQLPLRAARMRVPAMRRHARAEGMLHALLKRYTQTLIDQIAQGAACNRRHTLERRCARWLLMTHDRAEADAFPLTQEFLAYMLGVHRPAVAAALGALRRGGLVEAERGVVRIADRAGLERAACECYGAIRDRLAAVLA